jgi:hypothetical protein|tara:strand:+ start:285 stop:668 length:384 start_codon:yes stop_codon:yes gene_type:complete
MEEQIIESAINIIQPVMESSMLLAAEYTKACGRSFITAMDLKYSMRYCAMNMVGTHIGTLFPDIYESGSDSDSDDFETVEETEDSFTKYDGDDELYRRINESYDLWENWNPQNPAEKMLKDAIDKQD